jgi:ankyrin repeat protein
MGHFGKIKALKAIVEKFNADVNQQDFYKLTMAHYAARTGELSILVYLKNIANLDALDCFNYSPLHYAVMFNKVYPFIYLYFKL